MCTPWTQHCSVQGRQGKKEVGFKEKTIAFIHFGHLHELFIYEQNQWLIVGWFSGEPGWHCIFFWHFDVSFVRCSTCFQIAVHFNKLPLLHKWSPIQNIGCRRKLCKLKVMKGLYKSKIRIRAKHCFAKREKKLVFTCLNETSERSSVF